MFKGRIFIDVTELLLSHTGRFFIQNVVESIDEITSDLKNLCIADKTKQNKGKKLLTDYKSSQNGRKILSAIIQKGLIQF